MIILAIETSCDETAAAVYDGKRLLSNVVASQTVHNEFGGVVPELASREHIKNLVPIVQKAMRDAKINSDALEAIAVTQGPGLMGSLLVGVNFAKGLAFSLNVPLIGVNHIEAHAFAIKLTEEVAFPFIALIISGGHTQLMIIRDIGKYELLGRTLDDAAGEAYDKVAKMLELGYPGGPVIDKIAAEGDENYVEFPRAMMKENNFDFSFSGLKTAVLYHLKSLSEQKRKERTADICASFQKALVETLAHKTFAAVEKFGISNVVLAGGVARNSYLRKKFSDRAEKEKVKLYIPEPIFCTDNAAMIAYLGYQKLMKGEFSEMSMVPDPGMKLISQS